MTELTFDMAHFQFMPPHTHVFLIKKSLDLPIEKMPRMVQFCKFGSEVHLPCIVAVMFGDSASNLLSISDSLRSRKTTGTFSVREVFRPDILVTSVLFWSSNITTPSNPAFTAVSTFSANLQTPLRITANWFPPALLWAR